MVMINPEGDKMKCPFCENSNFTVLTDKLRDSSGRVLFCPNCDLGILEEGYRQDLKSFYDQEYRRLHGPDLEKESSYQEFFDAYVNYQQQRILLLKPYLKAGDRLLEVGCAIGHFMYHVKNHVREVIGVDYDSRAASFAQKACKCKTYGCGLEETDLEDHSFDVIVANQTLEHVPDPVSFIKLLKRYLKPNGVISIEVPNLYDPLLSLYPVERYQSFYYHRAHLYYFSEKSLASVMQKAAFKGKVYFSQDYTFYNHLHWKLLDQPQPSCHEGLGFSRLPLRDNISKTMFAEITSWFEETNDQYRKILARNKMTDNITFIGNPTD